MLYEKKEILNALESLREKFGRIDSNRNSLIDIGQNHLVSGRSLISWLRTVDPLENVILDILEAHSERGEAFGIGAGTKIVENVLSNKVPDSIETIEKKMSFSRYPTSADIRTMVERMFEEKYHDLLFSILNFVEADGNVVLKREAVVKIILEKSNGFTFNLESPIGMNFDERNVKCYIIDGFIESVGEIHHILEDLSRSKEPAIIFARNYANDVLTTLKHNRIIGKLNVLPIQVKFDFDDLNTLVDLAIIAEGDIVSSDKGDLIRKIASDSVPRLERVTYKAGKLILSNPKTTEKVKSHLKKLKIRSAEADEMRRKMLEHRLSSLSMNCLKVSIPLSKSYDHVEIVLDNFLRLLRAAATYGIVDVEGSLVPTPTYIFSNSFTKKFEKLLTANVQAAIL